MNPDGAGQRFSLHGLPPDVVAKIVRATARFNSERLWGHLRKPTREALPPHVLEARRREVVHLALSRALFRMEPVLYAGFAYKVSDRRVRPCNAPAILAAAIVEELDNAGWELTGSKNFGAAEMSETKARMALYDMLFFTFDFGIGKEFAKMGDPDPDKATEGRKYAVDRILETMSIDHAVLSRRPKR